MKINLKVISISITIVCLTGCASSSLPESLPYASIEKIHKNKIPFTVAVEKYKYPAYSKSLKENLINTKMFKNVEDENEIIAPDLLAKIEEQIYGTATIPFITFFTFGIIPTIVEESFGDSFSLQEKGNRTNKVVITYKYRSTTVLGWAALFLNILPWWGMEPEKSQRYLNQLSHEIANNAKKIEDLKNINDEKF